MYLGLIATFGFFGKRLFMKKSKKISKVRVCDQKGTNLGPKKA
jgi:hypothetical protein